MIYCRVSTKEQVEEGTSLNAQEKNCREYARNNGYEVAEVFIEKGESAKTADRTELKRLFTFCANRKNNVCIVIAHKIDRIARNTDDYSYIRILLKRRGIEIKSTSEYIEDTPAGRFMENMIATVSQFDNDVRTERCTDGMKEAMREGRYVWQAPFGYSNVRVGGKATIAPNEYASLVVEAFNETAKNTHPIDEVRQQIVSKAELNRKTGHFSRSNFYRMLRNPVYAGWIIKFRERHQGLFEPIVSQELFDQVQRVLTYGKRRNLHYLTENPDFPLRRLLYTKEGRKLTGCWSQGRKKKYPYYLFHGERFTMRKIDLETSFKSFMDGFALDDKHFEKLAVFVHKHLHTAVRDQHSLGLNLKKQLAILKENQSLLVQKSLKGVISDTVLKQQLDTMERELMQLNARLMDLPQKTKDYDASLLAAKEFFVKPSHVWEQAPFISKLKLQWFYFPKGVLFQKVKSQTAEIVNYFKPEMIFLGQLSRKVNLLSSTSDNPELTSSFAEEIRKSLETLEGIKKEAEAGAKKKFLEVETLCAYSEPINTSYADTYEDR